jgi:hypothetical protein
MGFSLSPSLSMKYYLMLTLREHLGEVCSFTRTCDYYSHLRVGKIATKLYKRTFIAIV